MMLAVCLSFFTSSSLAKTASQAVGLSCRTWSQLRRVGPQLIMTHPMGGCTWRRVPSPSVWLKEFRRGVSAMKPCDNYYGEMNS